MSQGLRELLANRRFAIPLIVLLAFCFVGLLLIGVILIWKPGLPTRSEAIVHTSGGGYPAGASDLHPHQLAHAKTVPDSGAGRSDRRRAHARCDRGSDRPGW